MPDPPVTSPKVDDKWLGPLALGFSSVINSPPIEDLSDLSLDSIELCIDRLSITFSVDDDIEANSLSSDLDVGELFAGDNDQESCESKKNVLLSSGSPQPSREASIVVPQIKKGEDKYCSPTVSSVCFLHTRQQYPPSPIPDPSVEITPNQVNQAVIKIQTWYIRLTRNRKNRSEGCTQILPFRSVAIAKSSKNVAEYFESCKNSKKPPLPSSFKDDLSSTLALRPRFEGMQTCNSKADKSKITNDDSKVIIRIGNLRGLREMLALWLDDDSRPIQLRGLPLAQHGVLISYTMFAGINDLEISASTDILPITSTLNFDAENSVSLCAETFLPYLHSSTVDFRLYLIPLAARKDPAIKVFDGQDSTTCSVSENQIHICSSSMSLCHLLHAENSSPITCQLPWIMRGWFDEDECIGSLEVAALWSVPREVHTLDKLLIVPKTIYSWEDKLEPPHDERWKEEKLLRFSEAELDLNPKTFYGEIKEQGPHYDRGPSEENELGEQNKNYPLGPVKKDQQRQLPLVGVKRDNDVCEDNQDVCDLSLTCVMESLDTLRQRLTKSFDGHSPIIKPSSHAIQTGLLADVNDEESIKDTSSPAPMVYSSTTRASELSPSRVFVAADVDYSQQRKQTNPMKATITPTVGSLTRHDAVTSPCLSTGVEATLLLGRKQPQLEYCDASTSPNMTTANKEAPNMTTTKKEASLALLLLNQNNHSNEERRADSTPEPSFRIRPESNKSHDVEMGCASIVQHGSPRYRGSLLVERFMASDSDRITNIMASNLRPRFLRRSLCTIYNSSSDESSSSSDD